MRVDDVSSTSQYESVCHNADILQVSGVQELDSWHTEVEQPVWQARLSRT